MARDSANRVVYMLDQCHNIEPKIPAMIRSVMTLQETFARALLVDHGDLRAAQAAGDVLEANRMLQDAYQTDVRPMLAELRRAARPARGSIPRVPGQRRTRAAGGRARRRRRRQLVNPRRGARGTRPTGAKRA